VPLKGKCLKCGGNLLLTIYKAGIEKYLKATENLIERYKLEDYLKQRLELIKKDINSIFVEDKPKQVHLSDFM
jgi:DNA polymerase II large subunit